MVAALVGGILVAGWIAGEISDHWRTPDADFFAACAAIAPLIGLGLFIEITLVMAPLVAEPKLSEREHGVDKALARTAVRLNATMLVLSVSSALYALGSHRHTAFLVVVSTAPWLVQLFLLMDTAYVRIGVNRIGRGRN